MVQPTGSGDRVDMRISPPYETISSQLKQGIFAGGGRAECPAASCENEQKPPYRQGPREAMLRHKGRLARACICAIAKDADVVGLGKTFLGRLTKQKEECF
ncbi:hypothetical protein KC319_g30 [Hortaea werneckii]|nr:hypothetical protein KC319_g30 [Hortaea werneckii]